LIQQGTAPNFWFSALIHSSVCSHIFSKSFHRCACESPGCDPPPPTPQPPKSKGHEIKPSRAFQSAAPRTMQSDDQNTARWLYCHTQD